MPHTQIVDSEAECRIRYIESSELVVHVIGGFLKLGNLLLTWGNVSFKFLDLIVQNKLKLFQLLSLFLE